MILDWIRKPSPSSLALGLAATLLTGVVGCGGKGPETGDAVVVTEPNASVPTVGSTSAAPSGESPAANAPAKASTPAASSSSAPVKAEGWGTLKGQITLKGNAP